MVRELEGPLFLDPLPGPSMPSPLLGPGTQPCVPPLKPRALAPSSAGRLTPVRGLKEDLQVLSKLSSISRADAEGRQRCEETETVKRRVCAGPSPGHGANTCWAVKEGGPFGLEGPLLPRRVGWLRAAREPSLPASSPLPGHLSSPSSLPLWSLSQDKWLTCQTLRVLRPGELGGPAKVTQLTLEASSSFPPPQTAGDG